MTFNYPWLAAGIDEVPLELPRVLAYLAAGGMEGVARSGDLKVSQTATPSQNIIVAAGAFTALGRFAGQKSQSYIGYNDEDVTVPVTANGSGSTRYDLVYLRVTDPGQTGQPPTAAPVDVGIITNVASGATQLSAGGSTYTNVTGYPIARLAIPGGTTNITDLMVTDLREVVHERRDETQFLLSLTTSTPVQNLTASSFTGWPNEASWDIDVPDWATRVQIVGQLAGYKLIETDAAGANFSGAFQIKFGEKIGPSTIYDYSLPAGLGKQDAGGSVVAAEFHIEPELRGAPITVKLRGMKNTGGTGNAYVRAAAGTTIVFNVQFVEKAD